MIQFTLQLTPKEATIIAEDGGVAVINLENPESISTTYYQSRVDRLANKVEITEEEWNKLADGKAYVHDWKENGLTLEMLRDAINWLMLGSAAQFPAPHTPPNEL